MKKNIHSRYYTIALFLVVFLALSGNVFALSVSTGGDAEVLSNESNSSVGASQSSKIEDENQNDSKDIKEEEDVNEEVEATSSEENDGDTNDNNDGDEHQSKVSGIVRKLLSLAEKDGKIGDDVRIVAEEQASTSIKVKEDMDEVNGESSFKVFFFGTNFKNLGDLRSTIVTTENHIERLKKAEERSTSTSVKVELLAQISELEKVASSTQAFVDDNESKFSLFGWFVKLFSK